MRNKILVVAFYLLVSLFFFRGILTSPGLIIGGDWGLPETSSQMRVYATQGLSLWRYTESLFGAQGTNLNDYPFRSLVGLLPTIGINGEIFTRFLLIFLFTLAGFSMYSYCRFLKLNELPSILGGFFFITTPLFFNYAIMGWQLVLLSLVLLPFALITFTKSIKEQKVSYTLITGLLFWLAAMQSQSLVWYPLIFILLSLFIANSRKEIIWAVKSLTIISLIFFLMNISWLIPSLLYLSPVISQAVSPSDPSLLFTIQPTAINFLRLWGSNFNSPFELSSPFSLQIISLVLPLAAYSSLILRPKERNVGFFVLLPFLPVVFYLAREIFFNIPFSNVIRDWKRFSIFSALSYSVLIAMTIDALIRREDKLSFNTFKLSRYKNNIGYILVILIVLNSYPFWAGEFYSEPKYGYDIRLRTLEFPSEYYEVENMLVKESSSSSKVLYLPIGGRLDLLYDERFHGAYHEIADIFGIFAPIPSVIGISDKGIGVAQGFAQLLQSNLNSDKSSHLADLLSLAGVKYVIIRLDTYLGAEEPSMKEVAQKLETEPGFRKVRRINSIAVFENTKALPHIYSSTVLTMVEGGISNLSTLVALDDFQTENGIFFSMLLENKQKGFVLGKSNEKFVTNTPAIVKSKGKEYAVDNYVIPETGKYEVLVKAEDELKNNDFKALSLKVDGESIVPRTPVFRPDSWVSLGNVSFKKGGHQLSLYTMDKKGEGTLIEGAYMVLRKGKEANNVPPKISFKKINPTKYLVRVENASQPFFLVFSESYHPGWKAYVRSGVGSRESGDEIVAEYPKLGVKEARHEISFTRGDVSYLFKKPVSKNNHFLVNGYANAWYIDPAKVDKDGDGEFTVTLYFRPQSYFYLGLMISGLTFLSCIGYLVWDWKRRKAVD